MTSIHCNLVLQDGGRIISKDGSAQAQGIGNSEIIPFTTDAFITSTFPDNPPVGSPKRKTIQCIAYKYRKGPSSYTIRVSIPSISFPMGDYDGHCLGFIQPSASLGIKVRITYFGFFQFTTDTGTVKTTKNSSIMNYGDDNIPYFQSSLPITSSVPVSFVTSNSDGVFPYTGI